MRNASADSSSHCRTFPSGRCPLWLALGGGTTPLLFPGCPSVESPAPRKSSSAGGRAVVRGARGSAGAQA
eukprot:3887815-Alexandrium_andersonii.AAC.1